MPRDGGGLRRGRRPDGSEDCRRSWPKKKVAQRNTFGERKRSQSKRYLRVKSHYPKSFSGSSVTPRDASKVARVQSQLGLDNENGSASERSARECAKILRLCKQEL